MSEWTPIDGLVMDRRVQVRTNVNGKTVAEYADLWKDFGPEEWPFSLPVVAFCDGEATYVSDGWHRIGAGRLLGYENVMADIRDGTMADAITYALQVNQHGERLRYVDKRQAFRRMQEQPELAALSLREKAKIIGVHHQTIANWMKAPPPKAVGEGSKHIEGEKRRGDINTIFPNDVIQKCKHSWDQSLFDKKTDRCVVCGEERPWRQALKEYQDFHNEARKAVKRIRHFLLEIASRPSGKYLKKDKVHQEISIVAGKLEAMLYDYTPQRLEWNKVFSVRWKKRGKKSEGRWWRKMGGG